MLEKSSFMKRGAVLVLLVLGLLLGAASARTESVLYTFCAQNGCPDGAHPAAGLVLDQKGNLYGTTYQGGTHGGGAVFKLSPKGEETVLYSFCAQRNCTDGYSPFAGLVFDQKGDLYGTTYEGGAFSDCVGCGGGVVFKITPKGKEIVLHSFNGTDGEYPLAGVVFDQKGNLYGTTFDGGSNSCYPYRGCGVVFKLTPEGKETVLHSFDGTDGEYPSAGLVFDQKGNLYGTTSGGGAYPDCNPYAEGCGVVFKLTPEGKEIVLYSFCAQTNCTDGAFPYAGLVFDQRGNLYGTTAAGGTGNAGVVFKLTPEEKERVLYSFCAQPNCTDGVNPDAGLVFDQKGNLYGTTEGGGLYNYLCYDATCGVAFKLSPKRKETVLYSFCAKTNCTDGELPGAGLTLDREGNLYGTTPLGGAHSGGGLGFGVVFKLTP